MITDPIVALMFNLHEVDHDGRIRAGRREELHRRQRRYQRRARLRKLLG